MPELLRDAGGGVIRQMAQVAADSALQESGVARCRQQVRVVVRLQQQGVTALQRRQHMGRGVAQVGQDAQTGVAVGAAELQRFACVVGHGEGVQQQVTHGEGLRVVRQPQQAVEVRLTHGHEGAPAHPHRNTRPQCQRQHTTHMVGMFVGDENAVQLPRHQPRLGQALGQDTDAQPAVHQQA